MGSTTKMEEGYLRELLGVLLCATLLWLGWSLVAPTVRVAISCVRLELRRRSRARQRERCVPPREGTRADPESVAPLDDSGGTCMKRRLLEVEDEEDLPEFVPAYLNYFAEADAKQY